MVKKKKKKKKLTMLASTIDAANNAIQKYISEKESVIYTLQTTIKDNEPLRKYCEENDLLKMPKSSCQKSTIKSRLEELDRLLCKNGENYSITEYATKCDATENQYESLYQELNNVYPDSNDVETILQHIKASKAKSDLYDSFNRRLKSKLGNEVDAESVLNDTLEIIQFVLSDVRQCNTSGMTSAAASKQALSIVKQVGESCKLKKTELQLTDKSISEKLISGIRGALLRAKRSGEASVGDPKNKQIKEEEIR